MPVIDIKIYNDAVEITTMTTSISYKYKMNTEVVCFNKKDREEVHNYIIDWLIKNRITATHCNLKHIKSAYFPPI